MFIGESLKFSVEALRANKVRTFLTALGLVIGNAAVILVVTISITGREYILDQIRAIGSNIIYGGYQAGSNAQATAEADFVKLSDVNAVRQQLGDRIVAATGVETSYDTMLIEGKPKDVKIIGSDEEYAAVRNLKLLAGRFMDENDVLLRQKVALLTEKLAKRMFGSQPSAIGQTIRIHQLQFTVIGTFKERTESFGLSELSSETVLIPITVIRYFLPVERIDPIYVQARSAEDVEPLTVAVRQIVESRHRPGAKYDIENLSGILDAAKKIAMVLSIVLLLVSAIALIISGIGIMNIMLVTVTERTREIGLRMAVGASRREVLQQFLSEAVLISVSGGAVGILIGVSIPLSIRFFTDAFRVPVSVLSVFVAFVVSLLVGVIFGIIPANRASHLNPTEALRYE
ncbi:MAG TPA: ABC transporter permease [Bryobacteraceae bacterium]|nr:ABC transporter permease [Bryobacteraceae bacterium]